VDTKPAVVAVVDDEESVCRALKRLLVSAGLKVESYAGGRAFLDSLSSHVPSCVVLDLHMPDVSGFDVQSTLAEMGDGPPVVVITGHDAADVRQRAMDGGAAAYLRKPVDDEVLLAAVADAMARPKPP
jgi:FixJ family two-component response regulator